MRFKNVGNLTKTPYQDFTAAILGYKFDSIKVILIFLYILLYLPFCFILNEDIGILTSYAPDPGTINAAMFELLENYNFYDHYHSRYYGWTYLAINHLFLWPLNLLLDFFDVANKTYILLFSIKLIFFILGLVCVILFHEILLKIFKNNRLLIIMGSLYFIVGDLFYIFYFIHPETTGLLMMFLGIMSLLNYLKNPKIKYYIYGIISLTASALSKQVFFFIAVPLLLTFAAIFFRQQNQKILPFVKSQAFREFTFYSLLTAFITVLIINPFIITDFSNALGHQIKLGKIHNQDGFLLKLLTFNEAIKLWLMVFISVPISTIFLIFSPFSLVYYSYMVQKNNKKEYLFVTLIILITYIVLFAVIYLNKLYVLSLYLAPVYPFFIIYDLYLIKTLRDSKNKEIQQISKILIGFLIVILLKSLLFCYLEIKSTILDHKKSINYEAYNYVIDNFNKNDKVIYGINTPIPYKIGENYCNYWLEEDCLKKFKPDYIVIVKDFKVNGQTPKKLLTILEYIKNEDMQIFNEFKKTEHVYKITFFKNRYHK